MKGNIVCVSTHCLWQIFGAVKFGAFNSIHTFGPSLSLCSFWENTDSPGVSLSTSVLTVSIKLWWMAGEMPKPETPLYIRLSYRFLYLLLFSLLFFFIPSKSHIYFWTIFSALFLQLQVNIEVYGLSWLTWLRWLNYLFLSRIWTLELYRYKF